MSEDQKVIVEGDSVGAGLEDLAAHDNAGFTQNTTPDNDDSKTTGARQEMELHDVPVDNWSSSGDVREDEDEGKPNLRRDRPHSASQISRRTTSSSKSRASLSPSIIMTNYSSSNMYSYRDGTLDKSIEECKKSLEPEADGELKAWWLLTEIDHWDLERERIILLTTKTLLIIRFDFIRVAAVDVRRIALSSVEKLTIGDIIYPPSSFMPARNHGGLRIHVGKEEPGLLQRWNPWCQSLPYITLTHHLLIYNKDECETATFNVEDLAESLVAAVNATVDSNATDAAQRQKITLDEETILIETYASVTSMIYNQSKIGFNLERGGVSF